MTKHYGFLKKFLQKIGVFTLLLYAFLYIFFCVFVFFTQKNLLFFPSKEFLDPPRNLLLEDVFFQTEDNVRLHGWYLNKNAEKTVLFFHGNGGNISYNIEQIKIFDHLELNALVFDYREYGKSGGVIQKEEDLYFDARAALNYLLEEKSVDISNIIFWGHSLGGAIALDTAQNKKAHAVIVESTFFSADEMARRIFRFLPVSLISRFHFRSDLKIQNIPTKILFVHSTDDDVVPFQQGEKLYERANTPKHFLEVSGSHHVIAPKSQELYLSTVRDFLEME